MEARLRQALARAEEVARALADPETARNPAKLRELGREHARLDAIRQTHERLTRLERELGEAREMAHDRDPELAQLARADAERLRPEVERLERQLAEQLTPADPMADRDAIVEIRAGTGGDEAALFAADLFRMYTRYGERRGWKIEVVSLSEGSLGGLKEAIFAARGPGAYGRLLDRMLAEQEAARARERRAQVGTGDRSQKIRTYNFPQNRVTDHRIHYTVHNLTEVLDGDLDDLINALRLAGEKERLSA